MDRTDVHRLAERAAARQRLKKFGAEPRPRALIHGFDPLTGMVLENLFPTTRSVQDIREAAEAEFDVFLTTFNVRVGPNLYVVAFGPEIFGMPHVGQEMGKAQRIRFLGRTVEREMLVSEELPTPVYQLVTGSLVPMLRERPDNRTLEWEIPGRPPGSPREPSPPPLEEIVEPFVQTTSGKVLAGRFRRAGDQAECWCLPELHSTEEIVPWVEAALEVWSRLDNARFPLVEDWTTLHEWRTPEEDAIEDQLTSLQKRMDDALAALQNERQALVTRRDAAREAGDQKERLLLTEKGESLVAAVIECLRSIGFDAQEMDAVRKEKKGDKLEDIQVTDPDDPQWIALVEVKGYGTPRSAKTNDLLNLARCEKRFLKEHGREPSASWYVVNQNIGENPSQRPPMLHANPENLETFAQGGGVAVDTTDLFRLWKSVQAGVRTKEEARQLLRECLGRFTLS